MADEKKTAAFMADKISEYVLEAIFNHNDGRELEHYDDSPVWLGGSTNDHKENVFSVVLANGQKFKVTVEETK